MIAFLARRLLLAIPTLFGVLVVVFLLLYVAPGDPVQEMVGERADAATIARLRKELRLDEPLLVQFGAYAGGVVTGDLGRSYITGRPILQDIRERFPRTLQLAGAAMLLASVVGITIGVVSSRHPGGWVDRIALGLTYLGKSVGENWRDLQDKMHYFDYFIAALIVIGAVWLFLRWRRDRGDGSGGGGTARVDRRVEEPA